MPGQRKPGAKQMQVWLDSHHQALLEDLHRTTKTPRTQLLLEGLRLLYKSQQPSVQEELAELRQRVAALEARERNE